MSTNSPRLVTVHHPAERTDWSIAVVAGQDPALVQRVLQKLAVPEIELLGLTFARGGVNASIQLEIRCTAARAELAVSKLGKLWPVNEIVLARKG